MTRSNPFVSVAEAMPPARPAGNCQGVVSDMGNMWLLGHHRAHGVVVSHPLSMREALGSMPSVSIMAVEPFRPNASAGGAEAGDRVHGGMAGGKAGRGGGPCSPCGLMDRAPPS